MHVILLERIAKLGQMGDVVRVKDGFARNFLLPRGKALRATEGNKKHFEGQRAQLEARNLELKAEAQQVADKLDGQSFIVIRQAGETGQLYGSVATRDIAEAVTAGGFTIDEKFRYSDNSGAFQAQFWDVQTLGNLLALREGRPPRNRVDINLGY